MKGSSSSQPSEGHAPLSPGRAFAVLMGLVVLLTGYVALTVVFHIAIIVAGSLFLFFWLGIEKAAPAAFVSTLVGALGGLANAGLLLFGMAAPAGINPAVVLLVSIALLMLAVYMLLIQKMQVLFNQSYMLYLTVGAVPLFSNVKIFVDLMEGLFVSAAYFGCIFWVLRRICAKRDLNAVAEAVTTAQDNAV